MLRRRVDDSVSHFERNFAQEFAGRAGRTSDAFPAFRLIAGVMRLAQKIIAVGGEELIVYPVHRERDVATSVDVGMERAAEVDNEALLVDTVERHRKLQRCSGWQLLGTRDSIARRFRPAL